MEFPRQEYWSGLPFPTPGDLPNPGIKPTSLVSLGLAGRFFTTSPTCMSQHKCNDFPSNISIKTSVNFADMSQNFLLFSGHSHLLDFLLLGSGCLCLACSELTLSLLAKAKTDPITQLENLHLLWNQEERVEDIFLCVHHSYKWRFISGPLSCNSPSSNVASAEEPGQGSCFVQSLPL